MQLEAVGIQIPDGANFILGTSHFIKTGIAFCEASGPCLIRVDGNDEDLKRTATRTAEAIGAGHSFVIFMRDGYPINVLGRIKEVPEVCNIHCASANPIQVIVAQTEQGRSILGVVDGSSPKGIETAADAEVRHGFLRKIGYKR